jgi:hypothetical protein
MFRLLIPLIFLTVSQFCFSEEFNLKEVSLTLDDDAILIARAKNIHSSALTIDAHADIEIPGKPSSYVGSDGLSKVSPKKNACRWS